MAWQILTEQRPVPARGPIEIIVLQEDSGAVRATVCPDLGFNCFSWQIHKAGRTLQLLHAEPDFLTGRHNTRSGFPILFPFPNRIRFSRFDWNGRAFSIPPNDASTANAIHGFVCQRRWQRTDQHSTGDGACVAAQFQGSVQAPETLSSWPADYFITARWSLSHQALRLDLTVRNPDRAILPFGVGAHPYFRLADDDTVRVLARKQWELTDLLPTGKVVPITTRCDLRAPRPFRDLHLDDVLTDIERGPSTESLLGQWSAFGCRLRMLVSPAFREAVVFTPNHRQAFCLEPYTCTTDAINLHRRGVDAGLLTLESGGQWQAAIVVEVEAP